MPHTGTTPPMSGQTSLMVRSCSRRTPAVITPPVAAIKIPRRPMILRVNTLPGSMYVRVGNSLIMPLLNVYPVMLKTDRKQRMVSVMARMQKPPARGPRPIGGADHPVLGGSPGPDWRVPMTRLVLTFNAWRSWQVERGSTERGFGPGAACSMNTVGRPRPAGAVEPRHKHPTAAASEVRRPGVADRGRSGGCQPRVGDVRNLRAPERVERAVRPLPQLQSVLVGPGHLDRPDVAHHRSGGQPDAAPNTDLAGLPSHARGADRRGRQ